MLHLEPTVVSLMKWLSERHPNGIKHGAFPSPVPIATEIRDGRDHENVDIIDGGNLHFPDYNHQARYLAEQGFRFVGIGASGGQENAQHGSSIMSSGMTNCEMGDACSIT